MPGLSKRNSRMTTWFTGDKLPSENPNLSKEEESLLRASAVGDVTTLETIVHSGINFNCKNAMERTPLQLAVDSESPDAVKLLIGVSKHKTIHYGLLYALDSGREGMALTILKHTKYVDEIEGSKGGDSGEVDTHSKYATDVTPLLLASQENLYEVVYLLMERGHSIQQPHMPSCHCPECRRELLLDPFRFAREQLNIYRGLASESYLSLNSEDPILAAFELGQVLRKVASKETHYKDDYLELAEQVSDYSVKLMDKVYAMDEVDIILDKTEDKEETYETLARARLAVNYEEKKFIAHPSCQVRIAHKFFEGFVVSHKSKHVIRLSYHMGFILSYPLFALLYLVVPKSRLVQHIRSPVAKFLTHTLFYLVMLLLIAWATANADDFLFDLKEFSIPTGAGVDAKFRSHIANQTGTAVYFVRANSIPFIHYLIAVWVIGLIWKEIKEVYTFGFREHIRSFVNWIDFVMLFCYVGSYLCKFFSVYRVREAIAYFQETDANTGEQTNFNLLGNGDATAEVQYYWVNPDRFYWTQIDPMNMGDVLFSIANVLSFTRITAILPAFELFGPLQISFGFMIKDILRFLALFLMVFAAFVIGLANLYWFYHETVRTIVELEVHPPSSAEFFFSGFVRSFKWCFWSTFGMGDALASEVEGFHLNNAVQYTGNMMYGAYMIISVIILLNLLIAMMNWSFNVIQDDADVQWKFAKTALYMEYIFHGSTLPVPLNIIPTPKGIFYFFRAIFRKCSECSCGRKTNVREIHVTQTEPNGSVPSPVVMRNPTDADQKQVGCAPACIAPTLKVRRKHAYKEIVKRMVHRFIADKDVSQENAQASELESLRRDLRKMKRELRENMKEIKSAFNK